MLNGIDVYHGDGSVNDITLKAIDFIFIKATEGYQYVDPFYHMTMASARKLSVPCGAYHFYKSGVSPLEQARSFMQTVGTIQSGDLPPVLDWEDVDATNVDDVLDFLNSVEAQSGMVPIIYTGLSFITDLKLSEKFNRYPLWLAHYSQNTITPPPWKQWTFWQHSEAGSGNQYDKNFFNGDRDALDAMRKA